MGFGAELGTVVFGVEKYGHVSSHDGVNDTVAESSAPWAMAPRR